MLTWISHKTGVGRSADTAATSRRATWGGGADSQSAASRLIGTHGPNDAREKSRLDHPLHRWNAMPKPGRPMLLLLLASIPVFARVADKTGKGEPVSSTIDRLLADTTGDTSASPSAGSLYAMGGTLGDLAMDFRATRVGDVVTVVVLEQASANAQGATTSKRTSSANASVNSLFGARQTGALTNLAGMSGQQQLVGQGSTSRQSTVTTTLSARVIKVLPNGNLILEGTKSIAINSESQAVSIRGIVRPIDIGPDNSIASNRVSDLEVRINGKGVVNDAIHRPNMLYRLLLGILPF
jgi:flagellar L-ring protein FlgH